MSSDTIDITTVETTSTSSSFGTIIRVDISRVRAFRGQPRKYFDEDALKSLGGSLKKQQRLPIKVKKIDGDPDHDYELIDGERRVRAAKIVNLGSLLAWVRPAGSLNEQFIDSVVSNLCRAGHTALETADALKRLREMGMTAQEIADESGYSVGWVNQHLSILTLAPEVQALMDPERPKDKQLPLALALRLVPLPHEIQRDIADEIMDKNVPLNEARFLIRSKMHEAGDRVNQKSSRTPNRDYNMVAGFVRRLKGDSKLFLELPSDVLVNMLSSRSRSEMDALNADIDGAVANLQGLTGKLRLSRKILEQRFARAGKVMK